MQSGICLVISKQNAGKTSLTFLLLCCILGIHSKVQAQYPKVNSIQLDTAYLRKTGKIGLHIKIQKNKKRAFSLGPNLIESKSWNRYRFNTTAGYKIKEGLIKYQPLLSATQPNKMSIQIKTRFGRTFFEDTLILPSIKEIQISNDTMYDEANNPIRLHLVFSNGQKIPYRASLLPIDQIEFECRDMEFIYNEKDKNHFIRATKTGVTSSEIIIREKSSHAIIGYKKVQIQYPTFFHFNFNGKDGEKGEEGKWVAHGVSSSAALSLQNGEIGEQGNDGQNLRIIYQIIRVKNTDYIKLLINTENNTDKIEYLIQSGQKNIHITSNGGAGGRGGDGVRGDDADKTKDSVNLRGNPGGMGGHGGKGGKGGRISILTDSSGLAHFDAFEINAEGGAGGNGGNGAKGGRGAYKEKEILPLIFGLRRGLSGTSGNAGVKGENGQIRLQVVDKKTLMQLWQFPLLEIQK